MLTCGTGVPVVVALHGGAVFPGVHTPPAGGVAVAVLVTCAGGFALTVAVIVYVSTLPGSNAGKVSFNMPVPLAFGQLPPPLAVHVHVWLAMPAGIGSATTVLSASTEPVLLTTIV